jgi:dynein heavy chain
MCILKRFYAPEFLDENHKITPSGSYLTPPDGTRQEFIQFIDGMALSAPPEVFGLHDNATLTKDGNDTNNLLNSVLDTESGGGSGGGGGVNKEEAMTSIAADIAAKTPENFDLEFAQLKYPVVWNESMNTVLCQELIRFNNLLSLMRSTLASVGKAIKGLVVMSQELEVLGNSLFVNRIPILWKSRSYPSLKPLSGYIADQQARLHFFGDWLKNKPPPIFWISGFFFTQAFLTGAAQNFARRYTIPIDAIVFDFKMMKLDSYKKGPEDGVYTTGLFLEGARWDKETVELGECFPKVLFSPAPVMHWMPYKKEELPVYSHYKCPLYKTSDRRGVLATTGHSSNFVYNINMPTRLPEDHWVQRGVAMLTQLDD